MITSNLTPGNHQAVVSGESKSISHSKFEPNRPILGTYRFGEITPHFVIELLDNDKDITLRCLNKLRTLPMKSPLMNDSKMHRAYFNVPMQAIIPFNYEKWRTIPVSGQDCPADAGTTITDFENKLAIFFTNFISNHSSQGSTSADIYNLFSYLALVSWFSSEGSLLHALELRNASDFVYSYSVNGDLTGDDLVDGIFDSILNLYSPDEVLFYWNGYEVRNTTLYTSDDINIPSFQVISLREFWMRFLQQPLDSFIPTTPATFDSAAVWNAFDASTSYAVVPSVYSNAHNIPVDLRRVHAYNIVCSHFFSNDHIDYIYTCELYRQNMRALAVSFTGGAVNFSMNGVNYEYDSLSAYMYNSALSYSGSYLPTWRDIISFFANTFNFNRSLRFMDYFTGSRLQPLAIGSNNIPVVGGNVNVIDVTKSIQFQRLRNFANRFGPRWESFLSGFFGKKPAYDYHNPFYIASTEDDLFVSEVENTSSDQQSNQGFITSSIKSQNDKYAFNFESDRDSVLIGVTYFDIVRFYPFGIPRIAQHVDKYDDFLPDLQYIGDQSVDGSEIGAFRAANSAISYTTRNQEYKVFVPYCFGGIRKQLKTWSYTFPNTMLMNRVSPDFIRSMQTELDKFYSSLTGFSLRSYFHFVVLSTNLLSINRPMTKNPQIL